ncbi:MAG: hypothetical protein FWD61_09155 [Phycisphaerales bacterium]|nr:hypothetical protein [Phycisphaerales bacterium]
MKALLFTMACSLLAFPQVGCSTLTDTPGENFNRMARAIDTNGKQMVDDMQTVGLVDRSSWLSKRPVPNN